MPAAPTTAGTASQGSTPPAEATPAPNHRAHTAANPIRIHAPLTSHDAEFGILVRSDLKGGGLGERLMHKLIDYLRAQGTQRLVATVLAENDRMLQLAKLLGFVFDQERAEAGVRSIHLDLQ